LERESQLLQLLDAVVGKVFATSSSADAAAAATHGGQARAEAHHTAGCARELAMGRTEEAALELVALLDSGVPDGEAAYGNWLAQLEQCAENLQFVAEGELEEKLRAASGESAAPGMPWGEFVFECREHLSNIERDLLVLEQAPEDTESIHSLFRSFHTIKGLTAIAGVEMAREVAHQAENILDQVRGGRRRIDAALVDLALASADYLGEVASAAEQWELGAPVAAPEGAEPLLDQLYAAFENQPAATAVAPSTETPKRSAARAKTGQSGSAVKVETAKLDQLVDLVGELVIAQSLVQLDPHIGTIAEPRTTKNLGQLARITTELQKTAMSLRVVPVGLAFRRMTRVFRDLVRESGKDAVLELSGEDAELDRTIVEQLADPLMHMVRNSVDHGLEPPSARVAAGKPAQGKVRLSASHQSGHVVIEVSDDGRGLNSERILKKAIDRGLVKEGALLGQAEILELIFEPGFSTSEKVTEISGRGVGMDVVKREIEKLRGRVEVRSEQGAGTTFYLRVPLTLAIINALVVRQGADRYILPLFAVREILPPGQKINTIEGRNEVCLLRDRVVPIVRLEKVLGRLHGEERDSAEASMIVIENGPKRVALAVDEVVGKQEVVIKSLGDWLGRVPGVAGGAILGDGTVGIILDLDAIVGREGYALAA
jgi:two-component system chemotaxis sensor kinase CheA